MKKIPKNEALVLARHGHEVYMCLNSTGEAAGYFIPGKDVPVRTGRGPGKCERSAPILANTVLRLRPSADHIMAGTGSRLGNAINATIKLLTLSSSSTITRIGLVDWLANQHRLTTQQAGSQVSEMLHRYKILEPAD